jgi:hypothetical protein
MAQRLLAPWVSALAEDGQASQVHACPVVGRDEDHEHALAGPAADDRARRLQVTTSSATGRASPQVPQTLPAPVISLPKTSYSSPPIAFPPDSGVLDAEFVEPARPRVEICVAGHPE